MFKKLFKKNHDSKTIENDKQLPKAIISESMYSDVCALKDSPEEILIRIHPNKKESYDSIIKGNTIVEQNNQQIKIVDIKLIMNCLNSNDLIEINYSTINNTIIKQVEEIFHIEGFDANGEPLIYKMKDGTIRVVFFELPIRGSEIFDLDEFSDNFIKTVECGIIHDDREVFYIQNPVQNTANSIKEFLTNYRK